jgi:hypothetical protein
MLAQPLPTHRVMDLTRLRVDLGYRDAVPARTALATTARWLATHPIAPDAPEEAVLTDPFDYEAEDRLIDAWVRARESVELAVAEFVPEPGFGLAYSGPGGRPRSKETFET